MPVSLHFSRRTSPVAAPPRPGPLGGVARRSALASALILGLASLAAAQTAAVGNFTKVTGPAPVPQVIPHMLGQAPSALFLWTEGRNDETFSNATAAVFRAAASAGAGTGVLTLTINTPAGTVANDVMIAAVGISPSTATITAPAGWTLVRRTNNALATANSLAVYLRTAGDAEPASYAWTFSASTGAAGGIMSFSGVDLQDPIDVENGQATASSRTHATPTVTTTATNETIVAIHTFASAATWTPPAGMTEAVDVASRTPNAAGQSLEMSYAAQAAIGATGTKSATASNNADRGNTQILALRPKYGNCAGVGMSDGTTSGSISTSTRNGVATSAAARRAANKILTIVKWDQTVLAEADLVSWDDTTFTINWTTNDTEPYVIHFIAIGGPGVLAKVVNWQMAVATGPQSITGVGFQPTGVIHIHANSGLTAAPPSTGPAGGMGFGVMDSAGNQWATSTFSTPANPTDSQRGQQIDAAIYTFSNQLTITKEASLVSMDVDGFTLDYSAANANAGQVFSLALGGVNFKAGTFDKTTAAQPAVQTITGIGFLPQAVFLHSFQDVAQANPVAHARLGYGASDGSSGNSSAFAEANGVTPSNTQGIDKTSKHYIKINNATSTIDAEADLTNLDIDSFTLNWTTNDPVATQMLYFAVAPLAPTEVRLLSFDATRYDRGTLLAWRTGYEIDNLGFNLYREVNGARTRVNASLIGGSGLIAGRGTAVSAEQSYARWDLEAPTGGAPVVYWLEDLDFNGTSTLHGPIVPVPAAVNAVAPVVAPSRDLADLRQPRKGRVFVRRHEGDTAAFRRRPPIRPAGEDAAATQWRLAASAAVKIGIDRSGWYRVTQPELIAAGLDPGVDPRRLRLFVDGAEVSLRVIGEENGRFEPGDAIEFYGTGLDTPYTGIRVYWLVADSRPGLRTTRRRLAGGHGGGATQPSSFWSTVERKDRMVYFASLENGDLENWFGPLVSSEPASLTIDADHLDQGAPDAAQLEVSLQGVTSGAVHQVAVTVNGTEVGRLTFRGQAHATETLAVPAGVLREGSNEIALVAAAGDADYSLVDVLRLSYRHTYRADADLLRFTVGSAGSVTVGGFASSSIRVVDITDPSAAVELIGSVSAEPGGSSAVTARVVGSGPRTLLAFSDETISAAASVDANHPSTWHAADQAHDYVIVAHPSLADAVKPLAELRAREGHRPAVIDVNDIYDEFSYGEKTPQAIRDFLGRARGAWRIAPRFVVLAGDATTDPRDYAGMGDADLVPTKQVPMTSVSLETASDDWFVDVDDTGLPAMAIGRLSVRTAEQAGAVVAKIAAYDPDSVEAWTKNVLLVADQNDESSNFERYSDALSTLVRSPYVVNRVFRGALGADAARAALTRAVNEGHLIVNFVGHGSVQLWGRNGDLLTNGDVASGWRNAGRLPLVVAMNCLNGLFDQIWDEESLAEALQRTPDGGAVAVWASSGVTSSATQAVVNAELFRAIFSGRYATLGESVAAAKRAVGSPDLRRSWIFFGDPAMRMPGSVLRAAAQPAPVLPVPMAAPPAPATPTGGDLRVLKARPEAIRLADFDGDGRADLLGYDSESGRWTAAFRDAPDAATGQWPAGWRAVAGDLNGDGRSDLILCKGETSEWIQAVTQAPGVFAVTYGRWRDDAATDGQLLVGDFNGDGRDDLLTYTADDGRWTLGLSDGRGAFVFGRGTLPLALRVQAADLNGDGASDVVGYDTETGRGIVALGDRHGRFSLSTHAWGRGWRVTIGHFGGRAADLFFYDPWTGAWQEALTDRQGRVTLHRGSWATGLELQAADLDGDRRDDIFGYNPASGTWMTAVQQSPGRFAVDAGTWATGYSIAVGDLSGDGRDDIVALDPASGVSFQCVRVSAGVFASTSRALTPGMSLVGTPR